MTEIDPYIRVLLFRTVGDLTVPGGHFRRAEALPSIEKHINETIKKAGGPDDLTSVEDLASELFDELVSARVFIEETHDFAGTYFYFSKSRYAAYRVKTLEGDFIHSAAERVGSRYFRDTFQGYLNQRGLDDLEISARGAMPLPASDRIVFLGDNVKPILDDIQTLKEAVRQYNDPDGKLTDRRERIETELSAGQELLKAPSVRMKAIIAVLMSTLTFIATEFAGGVIGDLAVQLLDNLRPLLGL